MQSCGCPAHPYPDGDQVPLMFMHGTSDLFAPYDWTAQAFGYAHSPKYFLTLIGAQHIQYAEPWLSISIRASIDFFRGYLSHERRALAHLSQDANVDGIARLAVA